MYILEHKKAIHRTGAAAKEPLLPVLPLGTGLHVQ